jgi:adenylate kinase
VFVLGGPGSGKGTQCAKLVDEFKLTHLSTGDLLRAEVDKGTAVGKKAASLMKEGKMVPTSLVIGLLRKAIEENIDSPGFLIDGYPRAMDQAEEFENTIGPCRLTLFFNCPLETLEARLLERGKTSGRADDNIDTIKKRFQTFQEQSLPVIDYLRKKGKCIEISSTSPVEDVYQHARVHFIPPTKLTLKNLVFVLGGPGSGKGTQCAKLSEKYNLVHISTGDLLREEVKNNTKIGKLAQEAMKKGEMVSMVRN